MKINNTLSETAREAVETALGYRFTNRSLLTQAFTRASYCNEAKQVGVTVESNEVPEFFGDSILYAVVADYLFERYITVDGRGMHAEKGEGELTLEKIALTDKSYLSHRIRELGFDKYLLITVGNSAQTVTDSMAEDLFEALSCAVWVDSGRDFAVTRAAVRRMLSPEKSGSATVSPSATVKKAIAPAATKPAKSMVKEWCEKNRVEFFYSEPLKEGTEHEPLYTVTLTVEGVGETVGRGRKIKDAETDAAEAMLPLLRA